MSAQSQAQQRYREQTYYQPYGQTSYQSNPPYYQSYAQTPTYVPPPPSSWSPTTLPPTGSESHQIQLELERERQRSLQAEIELLRLRNEALRREMESRR
jgi:hypothetical protein